MSDVNASGSSNQTERVIRKAQLDFMHTIEQANRERVEKIRLIRRKNIITGTALGAAVFGIYFYSMYAVKQETFLDDFEEPAKIQKE